MDTFMIDMAQLSGINKEELKGVSSSSENKSRPQSPGAVTFEELFSSSMKRVNALQLEAGAMERKLATGDVEDISEVVLASSRAEIAFKLFMELRNKFVDAYQQLSRMSA